MAWLYNMIAGILRNIINNTGEDFVQDYSCISPENRNNNRIKISGATGLQFDKSGAVKTLDIKQLLQLKNKLLIYAEELVNNKDYVMQMYLVETLDMALKTILYDEFDSEQSMGEIASLNDNISETGIKLYPRCECGWERKSRGAINHIVVENFIRNFLVIDYSSVKSRYEDHHFYITGDYNRRNRESLKIAAIPYSNKDNYNFRYYNEDICRFDMEYAGDKGKDSRFVTDKILSAKGNDIIMFPEIRGYKGMEDDIGTELSQYGDNTIPSLIVLPSYWDDKVNSANVLDSYGVKLFEQKKHFSYNDVREGVTYKEDIVCKSPIEVNVIHWQGVGRVVVVICRDFLNEDYINDILRLYKVTLLLVPSHSTGEFDFNNIANICKSKSCCVLWLNTCAAYTEEKSDNFKHISFLSKVPMKGKSDKIDKRGPCKHICEDTCRQDCILQYEIEFLLMRKGE